jgi:hypothetical protein
VRFRWEESFDLQADPLRYDLEISTTPAFATADLVVARRDLIDQVLTLAPLAAGSYFWRIIVRDHKSPDSWQLPVEIFEPLTVP